MPVNAFIIFNGNGSFVCSTYDEQFAIRQALAVKGTVTKLPPAIHDFMGTINTEEKGSNVVCTTESTEQGSTHKLDIGD